jgi:putative FmdB family regulatory protein
MRLVTVPLGGLSERAENVVPTYQYECTECGSALEVIQSFSDDALTECPECSGRLRKVFNAVGVVFKGSGFYRTDSRSTSTNGAPAKETSTTKETSTKTEKSTGTAAATG